MKLTLGIILTIQIATMLALGVAFAARGDVKLGIAQALLAAVTVLIYSGGVHA